MVAKRCFGDIRTEILLALVSGRKTVNDIATRTDTNWKTVDNHLIYLIGKGFVNKVFDSPYVKIFELNERGIEEVRSFKSDSPKSHSRSVKKKIIQVSRK